MIKFEDILLLLTVLFGVPAAIFGPLLWFGRPTFHHYTKIKKDVFPIVFQWFGESFRYQAKGYHFKRWQISEEIGKYEDSHILPKYSTAWLEDHIVGEYQEIPFELEEMYLTGGSTPFIGIVITIKMNKNFHGNTIVVRNGLGLDRLSASKNQLKNMEQVHLEDPVFEKRYDVYSTDQIESRYLLTPSFMERLNNLATLMQGSVRASFYDEKLCLMISSDENRFEPGSIFKPATFEDEIHAILAEMKEIFGIINALKLYEQTRL
jgi:hypothetical protein